MVESGTETANGLTSSQHEAERNTGSYRNSSSEVTGGKSNVLEPTLSPNQLPGASTVQTPTESNTADKTKYDEIPVKESNRQGPSSTRSVYSGASTIATGQHLSTDQRPSLAENTLLPPLSPNSHPVFTMAAGRARGYKRMAILLLKYSELMHMSDTTRLLVTKQPVDSIIIFIPLYCFGEPLEIGMK